MLRYYEHLEKTAREAADLLKATPDTLAEHIRRLQDELKTVKSENESLKSSKAKEALGDVTSQAVDVKGVPFVAAAVPGVDMNGLRDLGDQCKNKLPGSVILLISEKDGKVNLMAMAAEEAIAKGAHAGNLVKAVAGTVGGGGGGRPNMAQAGGKNPAGIPEALQQAKGVLEGQIH